jgi:hypothetical protein
MMSLCVSGGSVPSSVPSGEGSGPTWSLVARALAVELVLRLRSVAGERG